MKKLSIVASLVALLLLSACGPAAQEATATPTSAPRATAAPTATPRPGATLPSATATPQPAPTPAKPQQVTPKSGGILRYPLRTDPAVWDGQANSGGYQDTRVQYNAVHEMLFTMEPPGEKACSFAVSTARCV